MNVETANLIQQINETHQKLIRDNNIKKELEVAQIKNQINTYRLKMNNCKNMVERMELMQKINTLKKYLDFDNK